jgi:hypothetical protein
MVKQLSHNGGPSFSDCRLGVFVPQHVSHMVVDGCENAWSSRLLLHSQRSSGIVAHAEGERFELTFDMLVLAALDINMSSLAFQEHGKPSPATSSRHGPRKTRNLAGGSEGASNLRTFIFLPSISFAV